MGKGNGIQLIFYSTNDIRVTVAQAGHSGTARGIEVGFACLIDDVGAVTRDRKRQITERMAVENVGHRFG